MSYQFSRIRQKIEKLDGDLTLREMSNLSLESREITITAVLTAFGLLISTIITSLTGGGAAGVGGSLNPPKKHLSSLKSG